MNAHTEISPTFRHRTPFVADMEARYRKLDRRSGAEFALMRCEALAEIKAIAKASGWGESILLDALADEITDCQPVIQACRSIHKAVDADDIYGAAEDLELAAGALVDELRGRAA